MKPKKLKKRFSLEWAFEPFENDPVFYSRRMFGGLAAYLGEKIVLVLFEREDDTDWNGILFPTTRESHEAIIREFDSLVPHSILPKWLYLPMSAADFESTTERIARLIARGDPRFGVVAEKKKTKKRKNRR